MRRDQSSACSQRCWPWLLMGVALIFQMTSLHAMGQPWWCSCGNPVPWCFQTKSLHNSQHLVDAYSFTHLLHGIILFFLLRLAFPSLRTPWTLLIATTFEVSWELLENSPTVVQRYRNGTAALGYSGDSVLNSLGDVGSMLAGFILAGRIGLRWSIAVFIVVELGLLWWIRDNLTLNVLMLLYPIESLKHWQMA